MSKRAKTTIVAEATVVVPDSKPTRGRKAVKSLADDVKAAVEAAVTDVIEEKLVKRGGKGGRASSQKRVPVEPAAPADLGEDEPITDDGKKRKRAPSAAGKKAGAGKSSPKPAVADKASKSPKKVAGGAGGDADDEDYDGEGDDGSEPELAKSQTQYARWHQQPKHTPSVAKRGVKICAWNVNGLRAIEKKNGGVKAYVKAEDPDIFCLNETKIDAKLAADYAHMLSGYHSYWACSGEKKGYAGVALFSKVKPTSVVNGLGVASHDGEGRVITAEFDKYYVVVAYVPNSGMKLDRLGYRAKEWDVAMLAHLKALDAKKPVIWLGDLNVANEEIDLANPKGNRNKVPGFCDAEREGFKNVLSAGFVDTFRALHPTAQEYSYWSVRFNSKASNKGWRVDYVVVSQRLQSHVVDAFIRASVEGSDHVPVGIDLVV